MRCPWNSMDKVFIPQPRYFCGAVIAGVIVGGAAIASSEISKSGTQSAVNAQNNATLTQAQTQQNAQNQQQANFNLVQGQEAPYRQLGSDNVGSLQQMLSGGYNMQQSPSAQYAMQQGTKSINSNMQARGLEGNAVQQLGQLSSSTAASDYSNRFNQLLAATNIGSNAVAMTGSGVNSMNSNLQSGANTQSGLLQSAAGNLGSLATGSANTESNLMMGAAGNMGTAISNSSGLGGNNSYPGMTYSSSNGGMGAGYTYNDPSQVGPPSSAAGVAI